MALGRNLTKRLQRLRSKSNELDKDDGFVSISFEQTTDNDHHTTTTPTPTEEELTTSTSASSSGTSTPREPITPSDLTAQSQRIYSAEISNYTGDYFAARKHRHSASNASSIYSATVQSKPDGPRAEEMDAKADEMAMDILEKVSADDYLREIRTGSWYIQ